MGKSEELHTYSHVLPGLAEAAERMEDAIGCQIGCQEDDGAAPEGKQAADSLDKVVPPNVRQLEPDRGLAASARPPRLVRRGHAFREWL